MSEGAGLYLHVPFCSAVCPYCDFAVRTGAPAVRAAFVDTLIAEMSLWADWRAPIDTIYLGGGTPSLLAGDDLARLLEAARGNLPITRDARLFLEANPEDVDPRRTRDWRALGVATVSLGVQSFVDDELRRLGRRHDGAAARAAVQACLEAGFDTVSVDLIFGSPQQSAGALRESLNTTIALAPQHVSCYQLTIHDGTTFARWRERGRLVEMPERDQADRFSLIHDLLGAAGWAAYEVSNFAAAPAHRSRHNLKYWHHAPYLGLGPSAHSFDGTSRWWNVRDLAPYTERVRSRRRPVEASEALDDEALALETLMLGLRTTDGVDLAAYARRFGVDLAARNRTLLKALAEQGLVAIDRARLAPTVAGLAVADGLAARIEPGVPSSGTPPA